MRVEDIALILHRWIQHSTPAETAITHYVEVAAQQRVMALLDLRESMPCCMTTCDRMCGRGATIGGVTPSAAGIWILMPICERCAREMVTTHEPILGQS
jgi:hypothetical protein